MPLDHYVPQAYLKNWLSPELEFKRLFAIRKSDMTQFRPATKGICAIQDGSTNSYLDDDRKIERYLGELEPAFNKALIALSNGNVDRDAIRIMSGVIACINSCSPTAMRVQNSSLKEMVAIAARMMDDRRKLPTLKGVTITEQLECKKLLINADGKYSQSIGIDVVRKIATSLTNCTWEFFFNDLSENSFFTSDYPIGLEQSTLNPQVMNKIVPLSPSLLVRIKPNPMGDSETGEPEFANFKYKRHNAKREHVTDFNRQIVRAAENIVLFKHNEKWRAPFIRKNSEFCVDSVNQRIKRGNGYLFIAGQRIIPHRAQPLEKFANPHDGWFDFQPT